MEDVLTDKIRLYYERYYRDTCSIKNFRPYVDARCAEEGLERRRLADLVSVFGPVFSQGQKHFILGAGTAGLALVLRHDYGCEVAGVEPDPGAFEIIQERLKRENLDTSAFKLEMGENLSFEDSTFDFAHAMSVIEHVEDVEKTIHELIRIVKPGGRVYLHCPNYAFPFEGHYKIPFPVFLPRFMGRLYLRLVGKSPQFLSTINFLTQRQLQKILFKMENIDFQYLYRGKRRHGGRFSFLYSFYREVLGIYPYQEVLITKR